MKKFSMFLVLLAFALNFGLVQAWAEDVKQDAVVVATGQEESFEATAAKAEETADKTAEEVKSAEAAKATGTVIPAVTANTVFAELAINVRRDAFVSIIPVFKIYLNQAIFYLINKKDTRH